MNGIYFLLCGLSLFCNFAHAVEHPDLFEKVNSGDVVGVEHCLNSIKNDPEKLKAILAKEDLFGRTLLYWAIFGFLVKRDPLLGVLIQKGFSQQCKLFKIAQNNLLSNIVFSFK